MYTTIVRHTPVSLHTDRFPNCVQPERRFNLDIGFARVRITVGGYAHSYKHHV